MTINPKSLTIEVIHNDTIIVTSPTILPSPTRLVSPLPVPSGQRGWLSLHQCWRSLLSIMRRPQTPSAPSDHQCWRSPAMSYVWYLSVARSPLIYCPTAQTTKEGHHVVSSFAGHTCSRLPDNGRLPVIRDATLSEAGHGWRRVVWSLSFDTVCLTRHLQARRHPQHRWLLWIACPHRDNLL